VGQGFPDGLLGEFQEQDPVEAVVFLPQGFGDVPGDGLALPVRVGPQINVLHPRGRFFEVADHLVFAHDGDVFGVEFPVHLHPQFIFGQVPDVAFAGADVKLFAQIFLEGLGLGGRFHDEQGFGHTQKIF
jgi:hypothetical protein